MTNRENKKLKTNWKYLLVVIILAFIVGGGILNYGRIIQKKVKVPEIKVSEKEKVSDYATPEVKEFVPVPVGKKIPNELANIFSKEMNKDLVGREIYYPEIVKGELPPNTKAPTDTDCISSESIDLNTDGTEEFIIFPGWFCGGTEIRGASGAGPIYVFQKINQEWKIIGKLEGSIVNIEANKTGGYYDITTFWPLGASSAIIYSYQWEETILSYELKKSEQTGVGL